MYQECISEGLFFIHADTLLPPTSERFHFASIPHIVALEVELPHPWLVRPMGGLSPIGAIGLGSSFLEYSNYLLLHPDAPEPHASRATIGTRE